MTPQELHRRLEAALQTDDLMEDAPAEVIEDLEASGATLDAAVAILRFMEAHPQADFGAPGPLSILWSAPTDEYMRCKVPVPNGTKISEHPKRLSLQHGVCPFGIPPSSLKLEPRANGPPHTSPEQRSGYRRMKPVKG